VIFGQASGFADRRPQYADGRRRASASSAATQATRRANSVSSAGDRPTATASDDLIVGASSADAAGNAKFRRGARAPWIFGRASGFADIDLDTLPAAPGASASSAPTQLDASGPFRLSSARRPSTATGFDDLIVGALFGDAGRQRQELRGADSYCDLRPGRRALPTSDLAAADGGPGLPHLRRRRRRPTRGTSVSSAGERQRRRLRTDLDRWSSVRAAGAG